MSLWDKDKLTNNRLNPSPQAKDLQSSRMAHGTIGFTLKQEDTDETLGKLILKDGRLMLQREDNTFVDLSNGNIEVKRANADVMGRMGYRPSDSEGAVEVANTSSTL